MSAESFLITNPKNNNRDLIVWADTPRDRKRLAVLKPGETYRCERRSVYVEEVARPQRLLVTANGVVPDKTSHSHKMRTVPS